MREREIARLVAFGASDLNIAARLGLREATIGSHLRHIYRKMNVHSRVALSEIVNADPLALGAAARADAPKMRSPGV